MAFDDLVTGDIRAKLGVLKWTLRVNLLGNALVWLVLALVVGVFLTLGIDYALHMDRAQRGLIVLLTLAGIAYVIWRFLLRPFRVPMDAEELALVLENYYGDLDDRLISTLQFAAAGGGMSRGKVVETGSEVLIRKVADQADTLMKSLDARGPVESKRTLRKMALPAAAVAVLAVFTVFNLDIMGLWFQRNVLFADVRWPQETYLTIKGGQEVGNRLQFRVVRGRSLNITVEADTDHVVPNEVTFHMDFPGLGMVAENIAAAGAEGNVYVKSFGSVADPFEFYVTGNDGRTRDCYVTVVDPPELLDVRFTIKYPAYMNRPTTSLEVARGVLAVPPGSRVALAGRANKDLADVKMLLDGKEVGTLHRKRLDDPNDPSGQGGLRGIEGHFYISERPEQSSMKLVFELTDTEKITNRQGAMYAIRIEPDRPPLVNMNRAGVRADVTARALIPLLIHGRDDYGVAAFEVCVAPVAPSDTTTAPAAQKMPVPGVPVTTEARVTYELDLEPMKLKVGSLVRVHTVVRDTLPESFGGPNTSKSLVQAFKIVSEKELMDEMIRLQKEIRQEFIGCVLLQAEVAGRVRASGDRLASSGVDAEVRRLLADAGKNQLRISAQCASVAQRLRGVLDEMNCNRVGTLAEKRRLALKIIQPLEEICKKPMINLGASLTRASKETDAASMREITTRSVESLDDFSKRLEGILDEMKRLVKRQELERDLQRIIDMSTKILDEIREKAKKDTGTIFDTTTRPENEK